MAAGGNIKSPSVSVFWCFARLALTKSIFDYTFAIASYGLEFNIPRKNSTRSAWGSLPTEKKRGCDDTKVNIAAGEMITL